ncbi:hypothetical protein ABZ917_40630 [Nonomuraea wenchangensis]
MNLRAFHARRSSTIALSAVALLGTLGAPSLAGAASAPRAGDSSLLSSAKDAPALAPTPTPVERPPFVSDRRAHAVTNVATGGGLIHQDWSNIKQEKMYLQAWSGGDTNVANQWFFEAPVVDDGYVWFRMRNSRSQMCAVPGGERYNIPSAWTWPCGSGDQFLWRAEPQDEGGRNQWRRVKFVSKTTMNAIKPFGNTPYEWVVMEDDGYADKYYWSVSP